MGEMNWWGVNPDEPKSQPTSEAVAPINNGEIQKVEAIHESDRVRARVAVMRGESELYFIKIPPDINMVEIHPAGGDIYEVVYHDIVYGYTNNRDVFGKPASPESYN